MARIPPLTVIPWQDFIMNPTMMYDLFKNTPGEMNYDENKIIVSKQSRDDPMSGVFKVDTIEELEKLVTKVRTCPLFVKATLVYRQTTTHSAGTVQVQEIAQTSGEYAVLVNTTHQEVKSQMDPHMEECLTSMKSGKKFCFEFTVSHMLTKWYTERLGAIGGWNQSFVTYSMFSTFNITNATIYNHCFDCNMLWCMVCCVCWLMSAPCYKCGRSCTVKDMPLVIQADVTFREAVVVQEARIVTHRP
ncbi:hypothetical protein ScPMuIL_002716 [Solemya velum]